jgi:transcriptional regulator with XRE-family HTH domain
MTSGVWEKQHNSRSGIINSMVTAMLIREARRRAGLSQADLAGRLGRPQSSVGRWEAGTRTPSLEVVRDVAEACGLELTLGFARADDSYDWLINRQLELAPSERLARMLASADFDPLKVLEMLDSSLVDYVLIGEVAAVLRGCPITLDCALLAITPRPEHLERLEDALSSLGATRQPVADEFHGLHAVEPWVLLDGATVEIVRLPAGTHGFADLRRDARPLRVGSAIGSGLVASVADLARIAEASPRPLDRAWRTALRTVAEQDADRNSAARAAKSEPLA